MGSTYIAIDLHFLVGGIGAFYVIAYDGKIEFVESIIGIVIFIVYSIYLIRSGNNSDQITESTPKKTFPVKAVIILLISAVGIYFGADYTIQSISSIAEYASVPKSIIALTALSLGTTLPELVVNISAIRKGKAEMAIGNVLGSCVFNTLVIPAAASAFGTITVPANILAFPLPVLAGSGILFYLLAQDKRISSWEGIMFTLLYILFLIKIAF